MDLAFNPRALHWFDAGRGRARSSVTRRRRACASIPERYDAPRMRRIAAGIVALSVALASCTRAPAPTVRFLEARGMDWMEEEASRTGVGLELTGIQAIDGRTAFLFGALGVPPGTLRSVLLRTADGGATWQEAMTAVPGSETLYVVFADAERGWALVAWTVEGPGDVVLYRSDDAGRTWAKVADIPARPWSYPLSMTFTDSSNGEIGMSYEDADGELAGAEILVTTDGGGTWRAARRVPIDSTLERETPRIFTATGREGSVWELDLGAIGDARLAIRRRPSRVDAWTSAATLPTRFSYHDGNVVTANDP